MNQEHLIREIKSLSDSIRTKNRALKLGISERDSFIETTFKPVVGSLKDISNKLENNFSTFHGKDNEYVDETKANFDSEHKDISSTDEIEDHEEETASDSGSEDNEGEHKSLSISKDDITAPSSNLSILARDLTKKGQLTRSYILKMLHSVPKGRNYHVYGARLDSGGLMIGDTPLEVDDDDNLMIKGKTYPASQGIFELIFKPIPVKYSSRDLKNFKEILKLTNAHRKQYSSNSPIHRNSSKKYKNVIIKLFPPKSSNTTGRGLAMKKLYETNIIYYNNVNKLVERLRLLWESKQAGHTGLDNEIVALSDELRKRGYIN